MVRIPISFRMPAMEMSDLDPAIQCYGLLGAEVDADPSDSETAAAVQALKANLASVAARGGLGWDDLRATMAAARAKPTKDAELIGVCRQQLEAWKAGRP